MVQIETGTFAPAPPFDFAKTIDFLRHFAPTGGEQVLVGRSLSKAVVVTGRVVVCRLEARGTIEEPELAYTLLAEEPVEAPVRAAILDRIRFSLSLDDDLRPFYRVGRADPAFAPIVERLYGYHQAKFPTPFENACWALLSQRTPLPAARKMKDRLIERFGPELVVVGQRYRACPDAARLAAADPGELAALAGGGRRGEFLHAVAAAFGAIDECWLRAAPYDEVEGWLRGLPGIGAWSASFVLLRGLGRMERLPLGERRLVDVVSAAYGEGRDLTEGDLRRIAARYGPWQGYWAHYLRAAS